MKKVIFKIFYLFALSILIISCEKDEGIFEYEDIKILELSRKTTIVHKSIDTAEGVIPTNTQSDILSIIAYEGPVRIDIQNRKRIPFVGTNIIFETNLTQFSWQASGSLEIIGDATTNRIRCRRNNLGPGAITLVTSSFSTARLEFDQAPDYARCPDDTDTLILAGDRVVQVRNYTEGFTYEWKVSNGSSTFNDTGRSITLPTGSSTVILTVLNKFNNTAPISICPEVKRTQSFTFTDPPACPSYAHSSIRIDEGRRTAFAKNYDSNFTYKWTVVKGNKTYYGSGRSINVGVGSIKVTLTVSKAGCTSQTRTKIDYIDVCPRC